MPELGSAILEGVGLSKSFGALRVLNDVDFTLRANEAVGIVGPNGAGKTTLLTVLSGGLAASQGLVRFDGQDVTRLGAVGRSRIGLAKTHQVPRPFAGMTVYENVFVAATAAGRQRGPQAHRACVEALDLCDMLRIANRRAETLGLLDRKRLELARVLATNPRAVLLDEIGGGLSDEETLQLVATIREMRQRGMAIVWIEHIVHVLLQVVERLVCMVSGRVIADGEPQVVMADPEVVTAYLGSAVT